MVRRLLMSLLMLVVMTSGGKLALSQSADRGLELIVYERAGCVWCARWDQEIAPIYPKADIGKQVPLRRVNLDRKDRADPLLDDPVRYTPTFVLLRDGKEVGRITGYHNDAFFWGLLESMVERTLGKQTL